MILLHGFQDIETPQSSRASVDQTAGNLSCGLSKNERIRRPGASQGGCRWASPLTLSYWIICAILIFSSLAGSVGATDPGGRHGQRRRHERAAERYEEILLDRDPPPVPAYGDLRKRKDDASGSDQVSPSSALERPSFASTAAAIDETGTARPSLVGPSDEKSSTTIESNSPPTSSPGMPTATRPLPRPFDGGFGTNYTQQSCPTFLRSMLNNETFSACLPLSLLLQNSQSFFDASKTKALIDQTLAATCNVIFPACRDLMASFAQQLRSSSNCEQDWQRQNHLVTQAYNGLVAYEPLYKAGCLKDEDQNYCFANAITNTASPSDSYVYYLPIGIPLPGASKPSCTKCLLGTMSIFQDASSNRSQPVTSNYVDAAQMIDITCGPTYINTTLPLAIGPDQNTGISLSRPILGSFWGSCFFTLGLIFLDFVALA